MVRAGAHLLFVGKDFAPQAVGLRAVFEQTLSPHVEACCPQMIAQVLNSFGLHQRRLYFCASCKSGHVQLYDQECDRAQHVEKPCHFCAGLVQVLNAATLNLVMSTRESSLTAKEHPAKGI